MHLKPYPKLQKSELRLEPRHQGAMMRSEWRRGSRMGTSTGPPSGGRCPLTVISTNTPRGNSPATANRNVGSNGCPASILGGDFHSSARVARKNKSLGSPDGSSFNSSHLLLLTPGWDNQGSLSLFQAHEDREGDGPLDIWAIIKPGNTKEKIAIFALPQRSRANEDDDSGGGNGSCDGGEESEEPMVDAEEDPVPPTSGPALRVVSMKAKGCWEGECLVAKRRRRSSHHHPHHQHQTKTFQEQDRPPKRHTKRYTSPEISPGEEVLSQPPRASESTVTMEEQDCRVEEEEEGKSLSVVEMVAFLEQRAASEQQVTDTKSLSLRSSTTITLSKAPLIPDVLPRDGLDEEGESVRVSDMVAKLESECLKQRNMREGGGGSGGELSRNNSLRRTVARVLLTGANACSSSAQPLSPPPPALQPQVLPQASISPPEKCPAAECAEMPGDVPAFPAPFSPSVDPGCRASTPSRVTEESSLDAGGLEDLTEALCGGEDLTEGLDGGESGQLMQTQNEVNSDPTRQGEEPLPGMLFFSLPPASEQQTPPSSAHAQTPHTPLNTEPETLPSHPAILCHPSITHTSHTETQGGDEVEDRTVVPSFPLRRRVSHQFLEMRFRIQLLLEPQQYLLFLPQEVLLQIFSLLPTQSLAALKCSCHYFKSIIETYGVRPADSLWVCDPRYKDDPCKQCKRRYRHGDLSLCRWHHKPYCQAMPYGPGYWMCCHGPRKDAPGCNVGVHDNRWVPSFHSINMPIYTRTRAIEE